MTIEELKAEADKLGYKLIKKVKPETLLPCTCGANSRALWFSTSGDKLKKVFYVCHGCGKKVYGKNQADLKRNWNNEIRDEIAK